MGQLAVVGNQEKSLCVDIQPPGREEILLLASPIKSTTV